MYIQKWYIIFRIKILINLFNIVNINFYLKNLKIFLWKKRHFRLRWDSSPGPSIAGRLLHINEFWRTSRYIYDTQLWICLTTRLFDLTSNLSSSKTNSLSQYSQGTFNLFSGFAFGYTEKKIYPTKLLLLSWQNILLSQQNILFK